MHTNKIVENSLIHLKMFIQQFNYNFYEKSQVRISLNLRGRLYWFMKKLQKRDSWYYHSTRHDKTDPLPENLHLHTQRKQ